MDLFQTIKIPGIDFEIVPQTTYRMKGSQIIDLINCILETKKELLERVEKAEAEVELLANLIGVVIAEIDTIEMTDDTGISDVLYTRLVETLEKIKTKESEAKGDE